MKRPLRVAHIGAGYFARIYHAPTLRRLASGPAPRVSLEAICDLEADRAAAFVRDFGYARAFTDLERMLEEIQPEAIICLTQPSATFGVLAQILPRSLPVFTEKPPGISIDQAERLAALAEDYGVLTHVAFNRRRAPEIERLKRWCDENGPLRYLRAEMFRNRRREADFAIGTAIHPLDCLGYLGGEVVELETHHKPYAQDGARDFLVRLRLASGVIADLAALVDCGLSRERYLAHTENALMEATLGAEYTSDFCSPGTTAYADNRVTGDDPAAKDPLIAGGFLREHEMFLEAIATGRLPDCCLQEARHSLRLAVAVQENYSGPLAAFTSSRRER